MMDKEKKVGALKILEKGLGENGELELLKAIADNKIMGLMDALSTLGLISANVFQEPGQFEWLVTNAGRDLLEYVENKTKYEEKVHMGNVEVENAEDEIFPERPNPKSTFWNNLKTAWKNPVSPPEDERTEKNESEETLASKWAKAGIMCLRYPELQNLHFDRLFSPSRFNSIWKKDNYILWIDEEAPLYVVATPAGTREYFDQYVTFIQCLKDRVKHD